MAQWWVFVHVVGVLAFTASHGVSMGVLFKLRTERDPKAVSDLLALSASATRWFYPSFLLLLAGGIGAGFALHVWGKVWIWVAIGILVFVILAMYGMATNYYRKVRLVAGAMSEGSQAVTPEQFDGVLKESRPVIVAVIGILGLLAILYLMIFQPSFGSGTSAAPTPVGSTSGPSLTVAAQNTAFSTGTLEAPAGKVTITLDNQDPFPHDVTIDALGVKVAADGGKSATETFDAAPGTYEFYCSIPGHKAAGMVGTLTVPESAGATPSSSP
jgi:plastocyanin